MRSFLIAYISCVYFEAAFEKATQRDRNEIFSIDLDFRKQFHNAFRFDRFTRSPHLVLLLDPVNVRKVEGSKTGVRAIPNRIEFHRTADK